MTTALYLLLIQIAAEIAAAKLSGKPADIIKISEGTLKLVQVAVAIQSAEAGLPIEDVLKTLLPYVPVTK